MKSSAELRELLDRIDRRGYPAYKETRGAYQFGGYVLSIDHVQGDPFAAPSKVSIHIAGREAGFPGELYDKSWKRIMLPGLFAASVSTCGGGVFLPGEGLRKERADVCQPSRGRRF